MSGVSDAEGAVLQALTEAWNRFVQLPSDHPDEQTEFRHKIHDLQHMIFARPAIREWNAAGRVAQPANCNGIGHTGCGVCEACKPRPEAANDAEAAA